MSGTTVQGVPRDRAELARRGFLEILRRYDPKTAGVGVVSKNGASEEAQDWFVLYARPSRPPFDDNLPNHVFNVPVVKKYD